jgi:tetratricopeptide (TPR) repeat protein
MVWPGELVPFYPFPQGIHFFDLTYIISGILMVCVTGGCLLMLMRGRYLFFTAWAYYLITLFPVVGIIQVGSQAAADRYTYLPSAGIFLLAGAGVSQVFAGHVLIKNRIRYGGLILVFIFIALGQLTLNQITMWHNSETLWRYVIKNFPGRVPIAHNNLGVMYDRRGSHDKAVEEYEKAIAINPTFADAHSNLGLAYDRKGRYDKAVEEYEKALAVNSNLVEARNNLGLAYYAQDRYDKAVSEYEKVLAMNPDLAETRYNLGLAYHAQGMHEKAVEEYEKTLVINPSFADAHYKLALAYYNKKNCALAKTHFDKALKLGYKVDPKLEALINQAP